MTEPLKLTATSGHQRAAAKGGLDAEEILARLHAECLRTRVAHVVKKPTPYVVLKDLGRGTFTGRYVKAPGTDFFGVMLDHSANNRGDPRGVYVECKHVEGAGDPFYTRNVRESQVEQLDASVPAGDVGLVCVFFGPLVLCDLYAVPWVVARGRVALRAAELREHKVRPGSAYLARFARGAR